MLSVEVSTDLVRDKQVTTIFFCFTSNCNTFPCTKPILLKGQKIKSYP